jgi:hypothetical protein
MTVAELEDRMGVGELARWAAYEAVEPFLGTRVEWAGGIVASTIANVHRGKNTPVFEPLDFMPLTRGRMERGIAEVRARQSFAAPVDEDDATLQRLVAAFGGAAQ